MKCSTDVFLTLVDSFRYISEFMNNGLTFVLYLMLRSIHKIIIMKIPELI